MLAAATSFFSRTAISQSYNIGAGNASRSSTPTPSGSSSPVSHTSTARIGFRKVQGAVHKVTNKRVSVWSLDKRVEMEGLGPLSRDHVLEVLKAEATALSRLRHPSILEMVEPLEETRNELIFATEPIQKGILQLCKGLSFLHSSARLIHTNLKPECIIINDAFPGSDARVPSYVQRSFDYIAPEYALDETLVTASDIYSLGACLGSLRDNVGRPVPDIGQLDTDLQDPLRSTLPSHPFFSSLPISTLNFLDRSNFTTKTREEKISFMKGLTGVLNKFSEGLKVRKILPSLLEEVCHEDTHLLPYILPNVLPSQLSCLLCNLPNSFCQVSNPCSLSRSPQNMLTLLDNLDMLQSKTEKVVFREQVLPLVYNALESEHAIVQERALGVVPNLCETIDYAEVSGVPLVFTKTRLLSVKVATLATFLSMVKVLDQINLTQKLCPLLSKIRTKEPAVIMATLSVQEAMGFKIEREAVATLVLPQLGRLLNIEQFQRFMSVIRKLGDRVEKEHDQFLRDSQRIEDRSALANGVNLPNLNSGVDFESLVGRANTTTRAEVLDDHRKSWDDDVWGPILNGGHEVSTPGISAVTPTPQVSSSQASAPALPAHPQVQSLPSSPRVSAAAPLPRPSRLGAKPTPLGTISSIGRPMRISSPPSNPQHGTSFSNSSSAMSKPNYNISFSDVMLPASSTPSTSPPINPAPNYNSFMLTNSPSVTTPPSMGSMLMPMQPTKLVAPSKPVTKDDWGDFDPLK
ncbi:hypothetical protein BKA82DRAFT_4122860 [Pisolithus tinctorius]|nr:hypothetical protein BKA82DRAFT_4122860 [Pisolithus tinctorius]